VALRTPLRPGLATGAVCALLQGMGPGPDRFVAPELAAAEHLVASGAVVEAVTHALGRSLL